MVVQGFCKAKVASSNLAFGTFQSPVAQLVELGAVNSVVAGSSPAGGVGVVVQLVRTPACHAGGRGFKSLLSRYQSPVAQWREQLPSKQSVVGSIPTGGVWVASSEVEHSAFNRPVLRSIRRQPIAVLAQW